MESLLQNPDIPDAERQSFQSAFGSVIYEFSEKGYRNHVVVDGEPVVTEWIPLQVSKSGRDFFQFNNESNDVVTFYLEGNCIYQYMSKWKNKAYYCQR